jgi:hypothetical protein
MQIPDEIYERVVGRYPADVLHRLFVLIEMRDALRKRGMDMNNRLIKWHEQNVLDEYTKSNPPPPAES